MDYDANGLERSVHLDSLRDLQVDLSPVSMETFMVHISLQESPLPGAVRAVVRCRTRGISS